jgi:hypothetical protein
MTAPPLAAQSRRDARWHRGRAIALLAVAGLLGGCDQQLTQFRGRVLPDTLGLGDRCAQFMQRAMPFASIDIGDRSSTSPSIRTIVATAQGTRTDLPEGTPGDRDLAVECTFTDSVLTAFRWTKGGPAPSGSTAPPPH